MVYGSIIFSIHKVKKLKTIHSNFHLYTIHRHFQKSCIQFTEKGVILILKKIYWYLVI